MTNRAERRRNERARDKEKNQYNKLFSKFNDNDVLLIRKMVDRSVEQTLEESSFLLNMIYSAKLTDLGFKWDQAEKFNEDVTKSVQEEREKIQKLERDLGKGFEEKMAKISADVEERVKELIESGISRKEAIEALVYEFPKLTKSMLTNAYSKIKASYKDVEEEVLTEGAKEIMKIIEGVEEMVEVKKKEEQEVSLKQERQVQEEGTAVEHKKLKVLSMTLKGENGTYRACENGVELTELGSIVCFENEGQVDEFAKEIKEVFAMLKS